MSLDNGARDRALALVRDAYKQAIALRTADLERINGPRPLALKYQSRDELFRDFWHAAGAMATFAVNMGLITRDDAENLLREYGNSLDR